MDDRGHSVAADCTSDLVPFYSSTQVCLGSKCHDIQKCLFLRARIVIAPSAELFVVAVYLGIPRCCPCRSIRRRESLSQTFGFWREGGGEASASRLVFLGPCLRRWLEDVESSKWYRPFVFVLSWGTGEFHLTDFCFCFSFNNEFHRTHLCS